jgi:hypothetical protein
MSKTHSPSDDRVTIIAVATVGVIIMALISTSMTVMTVIGVKKIPVLPGARSVVDGQKIERVYTSLVP